MQLLPIRGYHYNYPPPSPIFAKNEGGLVIEKFFIKDFLSKKFSGASRRSLEGGGVVFVIACDKAIFSKKKQKQNSLVNCSF